MVFIAADNDGDVVVAFVDIHVRDGLDVETCTGISDMLERLKFLSLFNLSLLVMRTSTKYPPPPQLCTLLLDEVLRK